MNNKKFIIGLAATLLMGGNAVAAPLLEKVTTPGFVMPEYAVTKRCTLNDTGTMATRYVLGTINSTKTQGFSLSKASIQTAINNAAAAPVTTTPPLPDAGVETYYGYQVQPDGALKRITLWQTAGGHDTIVNGSSDAVRLRNFIDLNCGDPLHY